MKIVSWNVQWGRGADGRVDLGRIIAVLRALAPQVICLQEVAVNFDDLPGGHLEDMPALLAAAFPQYQLVYHPIVDVADGRGGRSQFGNLLMSTLPLGQVWRHTLPSPPEAGVPSMPRGCIEATVLAPEPIGPLRVLTTHLEYYSASQRLAQAEALAQLQREVLALAGMPAAEREKDGPFQRRLRPPAAVLCGDLNCEPDSDAYRRLCAGDDAPWRDAWRVLHGDAAHPHSVGLHGAEWPDRPYCCDFMLVSPMLAPKLQAVVIEADTAASDHQPVVLQLGE